MRRRPLTGFTLVEILVVVAIIATMAAILFPVMSRAKKEGRGSAATLHMRQVGMAMLVYADEHSDYPSRMTVDNWAKDNKLPTCDPGDTWRDGCASPTIGPMVGSFAYVRKTDKFERREAWRGELEKHRVDNPALLASIFYASNVPRSFEGDDVRAAGFPLSEAVKVTFPDRLLKFYEDGSADRSHHAWRGTKANMLMSWIGVFLCSDAPDQCQGPSL